MIYTIQKFENGHHYIVLSSDVVEQLTQNNNKRVVCIIDHSIKIHCALFRTKNKEYHIYLSKALAKKLKLQANSQIDFDISIDQSEFQFEFPEELEYALAQDSVADEIFRSLTKGKQRSLMYMILSAKSPDIKMDRTIKIIRNLKAGIRDLNLIGK